MQKGFKAALIVCALLFFSCRQKADILVGFSGSLTGSASTIGSDVRNGVLWAIEQQNSQNGIRGHKIRLEERDDRHSEAVMKVVNQELIDMGAIAIIGQITSDMSIAALDHFGDEDILFLSATSSTDSLTGLNDKFFRSIPTISSLNKGLGKAAADMELHSVAILFDSLNSQFAHDSIQGFSRGFLNNTQNILLTESYSQKNFDAFLHRFIPIICQYDAVYIIADALHTAQIIAAVKKSCKDIQIILSTWAITEIEMLLNLTGDFMDGAIGISTGQKEKSTDAYKQFEHTFSQRFGKYPNTPALYGYMAGLVLVEALKECQTFTSAELKKTLPGLQVETPGGPVQLDEYGDAETSYEIFIIQDGKMEAFYEHFF